MQKVILIDDLDQTEGATTVHFGFKGASYEIDLSDKNLDKLEKLLTPYIKAARQSDGQELVPRRTRQPRQTRGVSTTKVDYTDADHFGQLHRGRITDKEAALVRDNLELANAHRAAAGQPPIDPNDPKEKRRYGF